MKTRALFFTSLVLALLGFATPARAATTVINHGTDAELRAAVANCGTVIFNFDGVIMLTNEIEVTCAVTMNATGHSVVLSGGNTNRLFLVQSNASLSLIHLQLVNGRATNAGEAILNQGAVLADQCRFLSNVVVGAAGLAGFNGLPGTNINNPALMTPGTPAGSGTDGQAAWGGAIYSSGTLSLRQCVFFRRSLLPCTPTSPAINYGTHLERTVREAPWPDWAAT